MADAGSGAVNVIRAPPEEPTPVNIMIKGSPRSPSASSAVHEDIEQEKCASQQVGIVCNCRGKAATRLC